MSRFLFVKPKVLKIVPWRQNDDDDDDDRRKQTDRQIETGTDRERENMKTDN